MLSIFCVHPVLGALSEKDVAESEHKGCNVFGPEGEPSRIHHVEADLHRVVGFAGPSDALVDPSDQVGLVFEAPACPRIQLHGTEVHVVTAINVALNGAHARLSNDRLSRIANLPRVPTARACQVTDNHLWKGCPYFAILNFETAESKGSAPFLLSYTKASMRSFIHSSFISMSHSICSTPLRVYVEFPL